MKQTFVFSVCGDRHVAAVNNALRFLKTFTHRDIIVVTTRTSMAPDHDQCVTVSTPHCFDDHQASIALKTSLHRIVGRDYALCCYLDSDALAVSDCVDTVFDYWAGPITFAVDHTPLNQFSRYAVHCECPDVPGTCDHLRSEIRRLFGVAVTDPEWRHWNGGVFLFNDESREFMDRWHDNTLIAFEDAAWQTRDQGTLVAAVWGLGLQNHATLPKEYNYIVDPLIDIRDHKRATVDVGGLTVDHRYCLTAPLGPHNLRPATARRRDPTSRWLTGEPQKDRPYLLHLINGGASKPGWKNFDDACRLLESAELWRLAQTIHESEKCRVKSEELIGKGEQEPEGLTETGPTPGKMYVLPGEGPVVREGRLSKDNRIVHGMWIGKRLSKLELLTLHSFVTHGHEFHLWCYDDLKTPLPKGVVQHDASEILPAHMIYRRRDFDRETGVGKGSYGAFSDLFRYKLLYEQGGYWVDMDVTCLRPFQFKEKYVFRTHRVGVVGNLMKCPAKSPVMHDAYEQVLATVNAESPWLMTNTILSGCVAQRSLGQYTRPEICNPDAWKIVNSLVERDIILPTNLYALHWLNEFWRTLESGHKKLLSGLVPDKNNPPKGGTLTLLYDRYGL